MGYHIIFRQEEDDDIKHEYVEERYELANLPITESTIIYQGQPEWNPVVVGKSDDYRYLSSMRYRGSAQAERVFMKQALKKGYMLEILEQDQKSFEQYYNISKSFIKLKRGDFLIRNVRNIEVEVKCKRVYRPNFNPYFYFEQDFHDRHLNMRKYTQTPILLAVYSRNQKNGKPNPDELYMIDMKHISKLIKDKRITKGSRKYGASYIIRIKDCMKGFKLIEHYKKYYGIDGLKS